jgi:hypothetical protein
MAAFADKHKKLLIFLGIIIIAAVAIYFKYGRTSEQGSGVSVPPIDITYENIEPMLSKSSLIRDLPDDSTLMLRFYNFDTGERQWERSYVLQTGNVKEGTITNADITFHLHSKYLEPLTNQNFCSVIQQAKRNSDLGIETELSKTKLAWKFKSIVKYRDCLGF